MKHLRRTHQVTFMSIDRYNLQAFYHFWLAALSLSAQLNNSNLRMLRLSKYNSPQWQFNVQSPLPYPSWSQRSCFNNTVKLIVIFRKTLKGTSPSNLIEQYRHKKNAQ